MTWEAFLKRDEGKLRDIVGKRNKNKTDTRRNADKGF